jgi:hypothetical protein
MRAELDEPFESLAAPSEMQGHMIVSAYPESQSVRRRPARMSFEVTADGESTVSVMRQFEF